MNLILRPTLDGTPAIKRTGVEIGPNLVALEFTTVTNACARIEMTFEEWRELQRDVSDMKSGG